MGRKNRVIIRNIHNHRASLGSTHNRSIDASIDGEYCSGPPEDKFKANANRLYNCPGPEEEADISEEAYCL